MAILPISRVANVTLEINTAFASRRGFGVPLYLTSTASAGNVDASNRTKVYGSINEVAADWQTTDDFYQAATAAFSQNPRPIQIKAGFYDNTASPFDEAAMQAQMDAIWATDRAFYWVAHDSDLRDDADALAGLIAWVEARPLMLFIDSNDVLLENPADTTNVAAVHKNTVRRTSVFYHPDADEHMAFSLAGKLGTFVFDDANTAYTAKFKKILSLAQINRASAAVQAATGFTPNLGQAVATGHMANVYVDIGGINMVVEGSTLTPNLFIDQMHAGDWIIARVEERILDILTNNARIPYTNQGMRILASGVEEIMQLASRAGLIANDFRNPSTGEYEPNYEIVIPDVFDVPESQRANRIAPAIQVTFRYAGAVHYATVNIKMTL